MIILLILAWFAVGLFNWGVCLGCFAHKYGEFGSHTTLALVLFLIGPCGLLASTFEILLAEGFYFRLKPVSKKEAWEIYQQRYPTLSYERFERSFSSF